MNYNEEDVLFEDIDAHINHFSELFPDLNGDQQCQYYDADKFNQNYTNSNCDLKILCYNIRSLHAHHQELEALLALINCQFDIICFTESWLSDANKDLIKFEGYTGYHSLRRDNRQGGGVSVFVNDRLTAIQLETTTISTESIETLFIKITSATNNLMLGTIYKPPIADCDAFTTTLQGLINLSSGNRFADIIICGDFNMDLLNLENHSGTLNFLNSMNTLSLIPLITKPTRITNTSATLIDNLFVNGSCQLMAGIIISDITDHFPIFYIRKGFHSRTIHQAQQIQYRIINENTLHNLSDMLSTIDFGYIQECNDIDEAVIMLFNSINECYKVCCPIRVKTISPKDFRKPWITNEVKANVKRRQNYFILYRQNKISWDTYSRFRNYVTSQIRTSKLNYFSRKFTEFKSSTKATWKMINNILKPRNMGNKEAIKKVIIDNVTYETKIDISNAFNSFFVNIGKNISSKLNSDFNYHKNYLKGNYLHSFFFTPITSVDISELILSLKNKSSDLSVFPVKVLKRIKDHVAPILSEIINKSLLIGKFPDSLKIARVVPIHKAGDKTDPNNYRPISVLPLFSKIFEKVVYKQLYTYLERKQILCSEQYGFRSKKSTVQALLNQLQYLYDNIDSGNFVISVFLDFKKAFDSVDHAILLSKLNFYGIRGNTYNWFASYLRNRKQYTSIAGIQSECSTISHGVPQGSILGPLLFLLFINDLPNSSSYFKYILFADDSTLSCKFSGTDVDEFSVTINRELGKLYEWLVSNRICINVEKTKYIIFSYKKKIELPLIKMGNARIHETDSTKFLGILFDKHLTFKNHVNYISTKIAGNVGIIFKLNKFLPSHVLNYLYFSLVHPYLYYGVEVWHGTYSNITENVFVLQKKACRAINHLPYNAHTCHYFKTTEILKLKDLYNFQLAVFMFKAIHTNQNIELRELLQSHSDVHEYNTRFRDNLILPKYNRKKSEMCIHFKSVKVWLGLPLDVKCCSSLFIFKRKLKQFYICNY